jgi:LysM repeat protein/lysophospholipase L1-like esterase
MIADWMKRIRFLIFVGLAALLVIFNTEGISHPEIPVTSDSLTSPNHIRSFIHYQSYYSFIHYEKNYFEWANPAALDTFFKKLPQTPHRKLKILHIGDSHLQADIPTGYIRNRMQELFGYGGRGLVFPYKAAATHAAYDYKTSCEGTWTYTRNTQREAVYDMGVIGATIHTTDSAASFRFIFRYGFIKDNFTVIKIFCKQDTASFDLKMKSGSKEAPIYIDCNNPSTHSSYIQVNLAQSTDTLDFTVVKNDKKQNFFECYGLMIEGRDDSGVLYNSVGINGAGYSSILKQRLFGQHLAEIHPDLVIIDLGANDFYGGAFNGPEIEKNLKNIIDNIKNSTPDACVLISNSQDIYYKRKRDILECKDFMELTKRVAYEKNCAFYDYYDISGGRGSIAKWYSRGLAQSDKIHLTTPGYYVRGELFLNAMLNSYYKYLLSPESDSLIADANIIDTTDLKTYFLEDINFGVEKNKVITEVYHEPEMVTDGEDKIYYSIRSGDNLGSIALKYGVTVKELQYWNGLDGTKIIAGQTLVIYKKGTNYVKPVNTQQVQKTTQQTQKQTAIVPDNKQSTRKGVHTVVSGDTLWSLSKKYGTTVDAIKKANKLTSDKLSLGQKLIIP